VAEDHEDSHKKFFDQWKKWITNLGEFDVIPEFIWITKKGGKEKRHLQTGQYPAHKERNISISEVSKYIGETYEAETRGGPIPENLAGEPEEPEDLGEQTRSGTNDYQNMGKAWLQDELKSRSLPHNGNKADLVARLRKDDESKEG